MKLLNQVKDELEKEKGYDFSSDIWTGEMLSMMYDIVQATEKVMKHKNEYKWLSEAFTLNTTLCVGCENPKETNDKLKTHIKSLKDLRNDINSILDDY